MALQLCNEEYKRAKSIFASVAVARGCKNYNLLAVVEQGQLEYWRFHQAELCTVPTGENLLLGEAFGAGGVNSAVSRGTDAWQDPAAGGRQLLVHFHNMHKNNEYVQFLRGDAGRKNRKVRSVDLRRGTLTSATLL